MSSVIGNLEGVAVLAVVGFIGYQVFFGGGLLPGLSKSLFGSGGAAGGLAEAAIGKDAIEILNDEGIVGAVGATLFGDHHLNRQTAEDLKNAAKAGDEQTLKKSKEYADEGDKKTLAAAKKAAEDGDAKTLVTAKAAADKGDADTLRRAASLNATALQLINTNSHSIASINEHLDNLEAVPLTERMFIDTDRYNELMQTNPELRSKTVTTYDACHTGRGALILGGNQTSTRERIYNCLSIQAYMDNGNDWSYPDEVRDQIAHIADSVSASGSHFGYNGVLSDKDITQETNNVAQALSVLSGLNTPEAASWMDRINQLAHPTTITPP